MKVLVIGGTGFIGSHVCDCLLKHNHEIRVLSRKLESFRAPLSGVEYVLGDFADTFVLSEALSGIDCVIHLVSSTVPGTSNINPIADITTNLLPTVNLLELMRDLSVPRLVFVSSGGTVYGNPDVVPVPESHPLRPLCSYAVVKIAIENYLTMYQHLYGVSSVILRASNPYGPRQERLRVQGLIATFLSRIANKQPIEIWGDGEIVRDYFYVSDLADLCVAAMERSVSGIFNAGSGKGVSIKDIITLLPEITGTQPDVKYLPGRNFDIKNVYLDITEARKTYSWSPQVSVPEGISKHWQWIKQRHAI